MKSFKKVKINIKRVRKKRKIIVRIVSLQTAKKIHHKEKIVIALRVTVLLNKIRVKSHLIK